MKNLVIVGTGAVAAEMTAYIEHPQYGPAYNIDIKGYLDINQDNISRYGYKYPYLGTPEEYSIMDDDCFIIAIGNNVYRKEWAEKLLKRRARFVNIIHPTSLIANTAEIGIGNILYPFTQIGPKTKIGNFNIMTSQSVVSHDCVIGDFNFFAISTVSGHVTIGNDNNFYTHSAVIPKIKINDRNIIQAGMVVDKHIQDDMTIFYRFKEKVFVLKENC